MGLSDHHLVYAVSRSHCPRTCPITVEKRTFKNYDPERFRDDLHLIPFDIAYIFEDIDDIYWAWSHLLSSLLDDHAPIKRKTAKQEHVPIMTPELLEAIKKRNKLKGLYNKSKCLLDWDRYKIQRNVASSLRRKAVSNYFRTTAANAKGNPKKFWQTVKPFMHSKKNISRDSIHLKEGDSLVVNKLEVAQIFSMHFSSFLNDNDSDGHHNDIFHFTSHPSISVIQTHCSAEEAFQFRSVCPPEVKLILKSLDPKKQPVMIRYRQEHCGMVLMLLLIRYLFLSTRLLILALCRLLKSWPKSAPSSQRTILMINLTIGQCRF